MDIEAITGQDVLPTPGDLHSVLLLTTEKGIEGPKEANKSARFKDPVYSEIESGSQILRIQHRGTDSGGLKKSASHRRGKKRLKRQGKRWVW